MKNKLTSFLKKQWPLLVIFTIWFIFAEPYFFRGKIPMDTTFLTTWFSPWQDYYTGIAKNGIPDIFTQIIPWKKITIDSLKNGQIPWWNPYDFAGKPHLANFQTAVFSPMNFLFFIFSFIDAWSLMILFQPLMAAIFMYIFCRKITISKVGSLVAGMSFMFGGFMTTWMVYGTIGYALLFLPLALYGVEETFDKKQVRGILITAVALTISVFSGHFQTTLYVYLAVIMYSITKTIIFKKILSKTTISIIIAIFISILISAIQWLPTGEFYNQSNRSQTFREYGLIPLWRLITIIAPDFFGNPVTRNDWLGSYAETCGYVGIMGLVLAITAIIKIKKETIPILAIGILSLILILPGPVPHILVDLHIPVLGVSTFSRAIVLLTFSLCVLGGWGFDIVNNKRKLLIKTIITFFLLIVLVLLYSSKYLGLLPDQIIITQRNIVLPITFLLLFLLTTIFIKNKRVWIIILLIIISADVLRFTNKWYSWGEKSKFYPTMPVINFLQEHTKNGERVYSQFGQEVTSYYKIPSLPGYDALNIRRYNELTSALQTGEIQYGNYPSVALVSSGGKFSYQFFKITGVKYFVYKNSDYDQKISWFFNYWKYSKADFPMVFSDNKYTVLEFKKTLPRVFFANKCLIETDKQRIIEEIFSAEKTVVLEQIPQSNYVCDGQGSAEIVSYKEEEVIIKTESDKTRILFLSDNYYPGWHAFIDGVETNIMPANYTFRAIIVPAGNHNTFFKYKII